MSTESNDLRCVANEIIFELHKAKEIGQIQLLHMACSLAIKDLDPEMFRRMIEDANHPTVKKG